MNALNELAWKELQKILERPESLGISVKPVECGSLVVDCGAHIGGGVEAGLAMARVGMAGLGSSRIVMDLLDGIPWLYVEVQTDRPLEATLLCQAANWPVVTPAGLAGIWNTGGPHGFSEVLYAFSSAANNNGSAFAGLGANTVFYNTALGICMFFARYWLVIPALAIAGSLARKKHVPAGAGTLPTHTPLFSAWLIAVIIIVGALSFIPALSLGPIVEHLMIGH